ncbi:MAG TPA: HEAT repeat domain-containing protein [Polyangia bacterium]
MHTLADEVVEFTMTLVRALHRVAQFDPAKPNFPRLRARVFKELTRLQRTQPELGYVVGPPSVAGGPPEVHVDGTGPARTELRRLVGPSIGGAFVLQLLEFMQQRSLVTLSFSRGITEAEWNIFLEIVAAPPVEKDAALEGGRLNKALLDKKVSHVALVREIDLPPPDPQIPAPVRTALGRLGRDVRALLALGEAKPANLLEHSERLVVAMASSFFRKFDVLRAILWAGPSLDKNLSALPGMAGFRARDIFVRGLPALALAGTTKLILRDAGEIPQVPGEPAMTVLRAIAERFLQDPPEHKTDEILREMCRREVVPITRLPPELQEWVLAEGWVEALQKRPSTEPPAGSANTDPVRLLQKAMRYALSIHRFVETNAILMRLQIARPKAIPEVFDEPTMEAMLAGFPEDPASRRGILALLEEGGEVAAASTAAVVAQNEPKLREAGAWILVEMKLRGVSAALRVLDKGVEGEEAAYLLLACVKDGAGPEAAPVFIKQLKHPAPKVRRYALTALAEAEPNVAESHVAEALSDPDESVRIRALLLCANTGLGGAKIIPAAIRLISRDARGASPPVVRAAIEVVVSQRQNKALAAVDADDALCRLAKPIGFIGRLFGHQTPPAAVLGTAISALGRLGSAQAKKVLKHLCNSRDPDVVHAAEEALAGRVTKTMAVSSVFASEVRSVKKL